MMVIMAKSIKIKMRVGEVVISLTEIAKIIKRK